MGQIKSRNEAKKVTFTDPAKKYPHLPDEDTRLRKVCYAALFVEYGENPDNAVTERLEKELSAIADFGLSGVLLILRETVIKAGLKDYEIANPGTFGVSFAAWLCGLTPYDPLKTVTALYPEFCFGFNWDRELSIQISVPDGKADFLFEMLKGIEGVGEVAPLFSETGQEIAFGRCIIPVGEKAEPAKCIKNHTPYFELIITTLKHLRLLERCVELTGVDPKRISLQDKDVGELFKHTDHPACIELSPYRLSAIGLLGLRDFYSLILYGNLNVSLQPFADLVRVDALMRSVGAWSNNQEDLVFDQGVFLPDLITCREDVCEYCRFQLGMDPVDSFAAAERVRKGGGFPDELEQKVSADHLGKLNRFKAICDKVSYLFPRAHSYGCVVLAWRCAWYRLHYPVEFYQAYFEIAANPQIARAVFSGRTSYDRLTVFQPDLEDPEFDRKFEYDVDLAVADEMYFRGIDLTNADPRKQIPDGVISVRDFLFPGQVTVLAGRPGMGKTALACDLVHISSRRVMSTYVTLYEEADRIIERIALRGSHPCCVLTSLKDALETWMELSVLPDPLLVIDFIPSEENSGYRELFEKLKDYAQKRHSPVLVISQISRKVDGRKNKRPKLRDLPMQNCLDIIDNVIMLYREDYYTGGSTGTAEAIFVKSPIGEETIPLMWDADRASFL